MTQPCELQGEMQTWLFYPLNFLPSRSAPLFVTPEMEKHNLASKYLCSFPEASDLPVQLDSQLPGRATSQSLSPACFYIINRSTAFLWQYLFLALYRPQNILAPHVLVLQAGEQCTQGRGEEERSLVATLTEGCSSSHPQSLSYGGGSSSYLLSGWCEPSSA